MRATRVIGKEAPDAPAPCDSVALDWDGRHRRRLAMETAGGLSFLLDLPRAAALRAGDRLVLEDGRAIAVEAKAEPLAAVTADGAAALVRIAWHLGNRHLPTQLDGETLLVRRDHVIEAMVAGLGGRVVHVERPFDPEGGAYGHGHAHAHGHGGHQPHHHDDAHDDDAA